ncbi:MAG TPA: M15 family metallopeptidase, partial [Polyangiaceae bacterium]|nr:M15 family metallopeptidase [Polyangiaceae bacterium]
GIVHPAVKRRLHPVAMCDPSSSKAARRKNRGSRCGYTFSRPVFVSCNTTLGVAACTRYLLAPRALVGLSFVEEGMVEVSVVCRSFIDCANRRDWRNAVFNLNGLDMYEMLRALKALDAADITNLRTALTGLGGAVNGPRIEYALSVVVNRAVPASAPSDVAATGQVTDARTFVARPRSILVEPIPKARISGYNVGLSSASNATMQAQFGAPRTSYSQRCQPVTNSALASRIVTQSVGPFRVTGLDSAVSSLATIMTAIAFAQRLVYRVLGTAGMHCARYVRGSTSNISNHSWGTAIDLTIDGSLDPRGDGQVQFGLHLIAGIFNANGWFWGAGFTTEDGQHFEAGSALVQTW